MHIISHWLDLSGKRMSRELQNRILQISLHFYGRKRGKPGWVVVIRNQIDFDALGQINLERQLNQAT